MIALLIAWCFAFPARHDPVIHDYAQSIGFAAPSGGPRLWSTQAISATVTYSGTVEMGTISLRQSMALAEHDGQFAMRGPSPFTVYLCAANTRPSVVYLPL